MMKKVLVWTIVVALNPLPAFAQSIRETAKNEAVKLAQNQRPASGGQNPYKTPAIVLMGAGGALTVLAFLAPSSVSCRDTGPNLIDISCGTHANKGLLFGGLGAIGVGAFLWMKGEKERSRPDLVPVPGGIALRHKLTF